jgi:outer membrane cobalamin receptor
MVDQHRDLGRAGRLHAGLEGRRDELISSTDGHHLRNSAAIWARQTVTLGSGDRTMTPEGGGRTMTPGGSERTELTPALRFDQVEGFAGHLSPMLMVRHRVSTAVQFRASAGSAFRPPSFDDLFLPPRASAAGNPNLKPEQSWNADLGLGVTSGAWTLGLTGFVNRVRDLIQWQPGAAGVWRPHNVDGARIIGAEFEASGRVPVPGTTRVADVEANYTWLDPRETGNASNTAGKVLIYRPQHKVNAQIRLPLGALSVEMQCGYTGPVFTTRANTRSLPGYLVLDAGLARTLHPAMTLEARCLNMTDVAYQDYRDYPAPGREWRLAMTWRGGR